MGRVIKVVWMCFGDSLRIRGCERSAVVCPSLCDVSEVALLEMETRHGHDSLAKAVGFKQLNIVDYLISVLSDACGGILAKRPWDDEMRNALEIAEIVGSAEIRTRLCSVVGAEEGVCDASEMM